MLDKNDEKVLVIPRSVCNPEEFKGTYTEFSELVNNDALFLTRGIAETDETHLQLIPYIVVTFDSKYIFTYRRLKAGTENRLHDKYSIGIGGHIEESKDLIKDSTHMQVLMNGAIRELKEEISIPWDPIPSKLYTKNENFLIYDNSNEVGRVHLGIAMTYNSLSPNIKPKETNKIDGKITSLDFLKSSDLQFENWTKQVLAWMS